MPAYAAPTTTPTRAPDVLLYCDGACSPNPGLGGWACILQAPARGLEKELSGAEPATTNNRMELRAALEGLRALKKPARVRIITDSEYLKKAFTDGWLASWQRNAWRTAAKQPVKNEDLWRALLEAMRGHEVEWTWVRGHADSPENCRCDELAVAARKQLAERELGIPSSKHPETKHQIRSTKSETNSKDQTPKSKTRSRPGQQPRAATREP